MIVARFQRWVVVFRAVLYMFVRCQLASGSGCLSCLIFVPSGPMELFLVLFEMANCTCVGKYFSNRYLCQVPERGPF